MAELVAVPPAAADGERSPTTRPPEPDRPDVHPRKEAVAPAVSGRRLSQWAFVLALALVASLVAVASDLAGLVVIGAVLAYLLVPLVDRMERHGVGRALGTSVVLLALFAVVTVVAVLGLPAALDQLTGLQARWESGELLDLVRDAEVALAARLGVVEPNDLGMVASVRRAVEANDGALIGYVPGVLSTVANAVVVPFVMFALMKNGPQLRRKLLAGVPNRYFEFAMTVFYKADAHLGGYLRGQALIALLVGTTTAVGLGLLGVDYYLLLGLITGLANFVPYIGFIVSGTLTALVSVVTTGGMEEVAAVVVLFVGIQTLENIVFQPLITGKTVSMHPVLVLLAILVGGRIAGVLGMALAVPFAAVLKVFFLETAIGLRRYHL